MRAAIRGHTGETGVVVPDAVAALRHVAGLGHVDPILLAYHPVFRVNPYQQLLYSHAWQAGVVPVELPELDELDDLVAAARANEITFVLHLHWTHRVLHEVESDADAGKAVDRFLARLDALRDRGGHVAWTVHNVLPHDAARHGLEAALQQGIVDRATVVHVMSAGTPEAAADWFRIPEEKILHVPHPSYAGAYPDTVSREQARWELGIDPDETVYALLGAIKPYKGTDRLLDAFDSLCDRDPGRRRLIVAGKPDLAGRVDPFLERCAVHPFVLLETGTVPAQEMQRYLRASDLVVLPYLRSLNSGVLMLALTFGLPVVAPAIGGIAEIVTPEIGRLFEPDVDGALLEAMMDADALVTPDARRAARNVAGRYDPARLSAELAAGIVQRVRAAASAPAPVGNPASFSRTTLTNV